MMIDWIKRFIWGMIVRWSWAKPDREIHLHCPNCFTRLHITHEQGYRSHTFICKCEITRVRWVNCIRVPSDRIDPINLTFEHPTNSDMPDPRGGSFSPPIASQHTDKAFMSLNETLNEWEPA